MLKSLLIAAAAVASCAVLVDCAHACESVEVDVLPFEYAEKPAAFAALSRVNGGPTFGLVQAAATARLDGCKLVVGYRPATLSVANELRADQCAYDHVMAHELEHVAIYRRALAGAGDRLRAAVPQRGFVAVEAFFDDVRAAQAAHDSDEEYGANLTACSGRVVALTMHRNRF